jgi:type IV fimbrial biogenesis protein FimT
MRHLNATRPQRGLTLIEIMIGLGIAAMLALAGAPFYGDYVANSRLRESGNTLYAEAMYAQSEAIKRNATVRLSVTGAALEMRDMNVGADGTVIRTGALASPVTAAATSVFSFGSDGRPTPFGTSVSVNLVIPGKTCSADQRCPGLRVDAGGATRLCGNHLSNCD